MNAPKYLQDLARIKVALRKYTFELQYDPRKPPSITSALLHDRTGCGFFAATLIAETLPAKPGYFSPGQSCNVYANFGILTFIDYCKTWAEPFLKQGFAPAMGDNGGNLFFVPVSSELSEPVAIVATDVDWETDDLRIISKRYNHGLSRILEETLLNLRYEAFQDAVDW